jgi:hypothetical protein
MAAAWPYAAWSLAAGRRKRVLDSLCGGPREMESMNNDVAKAPMWMNAEINA